MLHVLQVNYSIVRVRIARVAAEVHTQGGAFAGQVEPDNMCQNTSFGGAETLEVTLQMQPAPLRVHLCSALSSRYRALVSSVPKLRVSSAQAQTQSGTSAERKKERKV